MRALSLALIAALLPCMPVQAKENGEQFTRFMGFTLGKATFADVQEKLGKTKIIESKESGEQESRICYVGEKGVVSFLSNHALGGKQRQLLGFDVTKSTPKSRKQCAKLPAEFAGQDLSVAGLTLGQTKAEVGALVGEKVDAKDNSFQHYYDTKIPMNADEISRLRPAPEYQKWDIQVSLEADFDRSKMNTFRIFRAQSF